MNLVFQNGLYRGALSHMHWQLVMSQVPEYTSWEVFPFIAVKGQACCPQISEALLYTNNQTNTHNFLGFVV
jgi:hypothetical protein